MCRVIVKCKKKLSYAGDIEGYDKNQGLLLKTSDNLPILVYIDQHEIDKIIGNAFEKNNMHLEILKNYNVNYSDENYISVITSNKVIISGYRLMQNNRDYIILKQSLTSNIVMMIPNDCVVSYVTMEGKEHKTTKI